MNITSKPLRTFFPSFFRSSISCWAVLEGPSFLDMSLLIRTLSEGHSEGVVLPPCQDNERGVREERWARSVHCRRFGSKTPLSPQKWKRPKEKQEEEKKKKKKNYPAKE
ncbi:hypothetical protein CEXT_520831 [Caerostris extrusa]|uniref:Uncharacterized protein n=1 Tax=Caerostris extrusa TaxID=172846 RepID=A0AAV4NUZ8_CAEEX|nr:hypothetical protein CEXT_520831 [Caerostris extrusa]